MSNIKLFESKKVRSQWNEGEQRWYFSIIDVVEILSEADNARRYWSDLKRKLKKEGFDELYEKIVQLRMEAKDGKLRETDAADATTLLRIIQSIPSPKAEPFKRWLAQVGNERLEEIENPELATQRIRETYKMKGYSDDWIEKRMRGIAVRDELTDEWKKRGVKEQKEYSILTAEISRSTFGMTPTEYKKFKELNRPTENLRDHMTDLELIFTMLGEASTTEIARNRDAQGFIENLTAAYEGGTVAGNARKELESKTGQKVVTKKNYKKLTEGEKRKQLKDKQ
ncbi:BRO-N domain-containing protein [Lutispora saccharofermentans]|uniref:Bro-N domain-containing protein n=1 Tax=Lutispora saccharofermentans TaxID=3024236 RepID=A0ABT1NEP2_9FIRM|nr:Bro-N domain-containing protein [Lutispora saccharofermentans]MCQ1528816.1 Bro-N domain-containing protein [Lutispora saccharofermentans]